MNSRTAFLMSDRLLCCVSGQLRRSYVAPAATAEVFLNGIPAPCPTGCGLAVAWDCREEPLNAKTGSGSRPSSRILYFSTDTVYW